MCRGGVFHGEREQGIQKKEGRAWKGRKIRSTVGQVASILYWDPLDPESTLFLLSPIDIFYRCCEHNLSAPVFLSADGTSPVTCTKVGIVSRSWPYLAITPSETEAYDFFLWTGKRMLLGPIACCLSDSLRKQRLPGTRWTIMVDENFFAAIVSWNIWYRHRLFLHFPFAKCRVVMYLRRLFIRCVMGVRKEFIIYMHWINMTLNQVGIWNREW